MRDGRTRFNTSHRLHPIYIEPGPKSGPSRGLTPMNVQAHRSRMRSREVSERKQVGDAESLFHSEQRRKDDDEEIGQFARASPFLLLFISLVVVHMDNGKSYERNTTAEFNTTWGWNPT
ncbi:uncharacterized protein N7458_008565 [Penicillium daleae]|uniref:Uncharacterized protein n=1 Tax=Penicillium daleae TaxID=63821 RepID=A0AAD6C2Y3_9EURO|nr:uncharacterized protein N7458_008565 [Penicillium daleae]KAJ5444693.1 hypothetical protein N7458_008565 [Penicillium daleae]